MRAINGVCRERYFCHDTSDFSDRNLANYANRRASGSICLFAEEEFRPSSRRSRRSAAAPVIAAGCIHVRRKSEGESSDHGFSFLIAVGSGNVAVHLHRRRPLRLSAGVAANRTARIGRHRLCSMGVPAKQRGRQRRLIKDNDVRRFKTLVKEHAKLRCINAARLESLPTATTKELIPEHFDAGPTPCSTASVHSHWS